MRSKQGIVTAPSPETRVLPLTDSAHAPDADQALQDRWLANVCAASCGAARWLMFATATGLGVAAIWIAGRSPGAAHTAVFWCLGALFLAQIHLAIRIEFDARIFRQVAADPRPVDAALTAFDAAASRVGLLPASKLARPLGVRTAGTLKLIRRLAWLVALQWMLVLTMITLPA